MYTLATLYDLRQHLGFAANDTADDARLLAALEAASNTIERRTHRDFQPRVATRKHSIDRRNVRELLLRDDLLVLQSLTNGDGGNIALADVAILESGALRLSNGAAFTYTDTPEDAVQVTGIWGYHPDWAAAWADSGDTVQDNPLSANATTVTALDVDAVMVDGTPRFQVGHLLRIESEYVRVLATDTTLNTLTVARGVRGSTAASHASATTIEVYQTPADVVQLCLRWSAWLYREPDSGPEHVPSILLDGLDGLRRISVGS